MAWRGALSVVVALHCASAGVAAQLTEGLGALLALVSCAPAGVAGQQTYVAHPTEGNPACYDADYTHARCCGASDDGSTVTAPGDASCWPDSAGRTDVLHQRDVDFSLCWCSEPLAAHRARLAMLIKRGRQRLEWEVHCY